MRKIYLPKNVFAVIATLLFFVSASFGQITQPTAWTKAYDQGTATGTGTNVTIAPNPYRILVVGIATTFTTTGGSNTQNDPSTISYGGVTLTKATGNGTSVGRMHTWLYYLKDNAVMDGTARPLNITSGTPTPTATLANMTAWYAVYAGIDQIPISYTNGNGFTNTAGSGPAQLSAAMSVNANEQAVYISNIFNDNNATTPGYTPNISWTSGGNNTGTNSIGGNVAWKIEVADRAIPILNATDNAATSIITPATRIRYAMSAMSLPKSLLPTITSFTPSIGCSSSGVSVVITGTNFTGATAVTFGGTAAVSFIVNSATQITAILAGGTTGTISVTTPLGSATSAAIFTVDRAPNALTYTINSPTYCAGVAIANNIPTTVAGIPTSYSIGTALPAGLSFNTTTGIISGTPTAAGVSSHIILASNSCGFSSVTMNITVSPAAPISLSYSANFASYCVGVPITANFPSNGGGAPTSYSVSPALPAGLTINNSNGIITGTPTTATTPANYTVTASNSCGSTIRVLNIGVDATIGTITYTVNPVTYCSGVAITANSPSTSGGAPTSYSVSPALPAGLSLNTNTGVISGTPTTTTAAANYTVTGNNTCGSANVAVNITISPAAPSALGYTTNTVSYCMGVAIAANSPSSSGGAPTAYSVSPALPAGLTLNTVTGVITGTPSAASVAANYTITAANSCGNTTRALNITVVASPATISYTVNPVTYCSGVAITANSPSISGGTPTSYSVSPALPAGLSLNTGTGVISGTPTTVTAAANYTITGTNSCGSANVAVNITISPAAPSALGYTTNTVSYCMGVAIAANSPSSSGGAPTAYSVSPALPAGLTLNTVTGVITGTPSTASVTANYTITATNSCGNTTRALNITVVASPATISYTVNPATYCSGVAITANSPSISGGTPTSYSVSPALPAGLSLNTGTGVISGTPTTATAAANYTITGTNSCGSANVAVNIAISPAAPTALGYTSNTVSYCVGAAISANSPSSSGGAPTAYSVSPALPGGLTLNTVTGVITGTPSAASVAANYTITATNSCGNTTRALNITVVASPATISYTVNPVTYCSGVAITANSPSTSGGTPTAYSVSPALPAGLSLNTGTGVISGTPTTATAAANYTVTGTNSCGSANVAVNITISPAAPTALSYTAIAPSYCLGSAITNNSPSSSGGAPTSYSVSPALPAGLTLNTVNGIISGTPTTATAAANYTVTASNSCGTTTAVVNITVKAIPTGSLTPSATTICFGSPVKFVATTGYAAYIFSINGTSVQTGILNEYNTSSLTGGEIVTVQAFINSCTATFTAPTVTVNPLPVPTLSATENSGTANNDNIICAGAPITFTAGGGNSYALKVNGSTVNSNASGVFTISTLNNGDVVTVDVTNSNGCTAASASITITVNALPAGTLTATENSVAPNDNVICTGANVTFTATGGASYQFKVNGVIVQGYSATNTYSSTTLANASVITVDVNNGSGCISTYPGVFITVNALPVVSVTPAASSICIGGNTSLTASGATTYSWSPATGLSAMTGATVTANPSSTTTYTITGTNSNGCVSTGTATVTVNALPLVTVSPASATSCSGSITSLNAGGAVSYSWSPVTDLSSSTGTPVSANPTTTTTYTVTGTDVNGCINTAAATITINPLPTISVTPSSASICIGGNTSLTASGAVTYNWSPATGLSATTGSTVTANPTTTTTYTITGTNSNGCVNTTTVTITVNPLPVISVTPSSATICIGGTTSLTASGAVTYSWSPATGLSATTGATVTANPTSTITYTVTGTNSNGCVNTTTVTVTVNPLPTISVTPASPAICIGSNTSLTASGAVSYNWSPATGLSATTGATVTANPSSTVTYTVTGTNSNGCVNTTTVTVTVNPLPTISVTPASPAICIGSNTSLTASGATTYSWSPATGLSATTGATVTANSLSTTTYTVTGTNSNGCVNTTTVTVTVNPLPIISVTPASPAICIGSNTSLTASGATTYSWSPATGLSATTGTTVTANPSSTITYTVTGTNSNGCVNTTTVTVTVNPLPTISVTPSSATICNGFSTSLTASGATSYSWSPATGLSATTGATVTANPTTTTTYTITGTNSNGCVNTTTVTITVNPLPVISVTPSSATICIGGTTSLTASGAVTYSWSPATGLSATTGATVTANPTSTTTYTVTGTNSNGCVNTTTVTVTVNPLPVISVTPLSATICNGSNTSLTASGAVSYSWSPATGLSATTGATVTASPTTTRTYTVTGTNSNGCVNTTTVTVTVNPLPTISVTPASPAICIGSNTSLTASGATTYSWSPATGLSATTGATVTANPLSTTTYTVTGTNSNGCVNTTTVTVTVNALPIISVTPASPAICIGSNTSLTASGATTYSWSPATGLSATIGATVTANPSSTITYTVTGTNSNGCVNTTTVTVTVNPLPTISVTPSSATICNGFSTSLTASGATSYSWSPATGLSATTGATVTANPTTTTTYTITGTNSNGCVNTTTVTITVNPSPVPTITGKNPICINDKQTYTTQAGQTNYVWTVTGGTVTVGTGGTTQNTIEVTWTSAGAKTINVNYTNSFGCTAATSSSFSNAPTAAPPTFTGGPTIVCVNSTGNTYTTQSGKTDYLWAVTGGTITSGGGISDNFVTVTWNTVGSQSVSTNYSDIGGCNAASPTFYGVTVNPLTGATNFTAGSTTVCQNAVDEQYTATASNSTSITYAVSPGTAGTINTSTGLIDWNAAFSGTATITATATGLCGTTTANRIVTVNPSTGVTIFTAGATTVCQNAVDEKYTATATNSTSITYAVSPGTAGTINISTGLMDWSAVFSGTATITATSTGLCGTTTANRIVTVNPSTGVTNFTAGATTVCQNAVDEQYTATATNSTSITYAVSPGTAGTINTSTGLMDWNAAFSGTATITATSTGLCGTTTANRVVTVNPSTGVTTFTAGATTVCQNAVDETYTATVSNSTFITYSVSPATAGAINGSTGLMDWNAAFSGTATITATATGLCGTTTANRVVTVNPSTGVTNFTSGATTVCQNAVDEQYTATALNSTSITYAVSPGTAGTINTTTGLMDWNAAFSGTATITATATGLCGTTTSNRVVTVNPSTGVTTFTTGATTVCQNAVDEQYTATALNSTSITYAVSPGTAGTINTTSGLMDWNAAFSGTATITATATGLCGTTTANRIVTVNPSTGVTSFTAGATTVCQNAVDEQYTATALNSTSITYALSPGTAGTINTSTGLMDWNAAFSGTATITATATGLCGTTTANRIVTVNPSTGVTSFTAGATTVCQNAVDEQYTATALNSTSISYAVSPGTAGTINTTSGLMDWNAAFSGTATITATATGLCGTTTANRIVTVNPSTGVTSFTAGATTVCQNAVDEQYTATAPNSTSISYSISPASAGTINTSTGLMDWNAAFSGTASITATATGLCGTTTGNRVVTVNPSTGVTTFTTGATTVCQNALDEKYTATALNSTSISYAVSPGTAGTINTSTGLMDWNAAFNGTATITATATGLCGTTTANRLVTVNPSTGVTTFTTGSITVCQNAVDEQYTATASNSTSITYAVSPGTAGTINTSTGLMDWNAAFSGTATITATSTGLCGSTTANRVVTVNPSTGVTGFTTGATTVCQNAVDEQYTATASNSTSITYTVSPGTAGTINTSTGLMDWNAAFSGTATITATATGLCGTTTTNRIVTVNPSTGVISFTTGATTVCQNAIDEKYTATASGSTSITYAVSPGTAGTINTGTGLMDWSAAFNGTATITATATGLCGTTTANSVVTVNALPAAPTLTPTIATICQNSIQPLAAGTAPVTSSVSFSSGIINLAIPDNNSTGVISTIAVSGIPAGAVINSVSILYNITHTNDDDIRINLKSPNTNIFNLVDRQGGTGDNYTNTNITSNPATSIVGQSAPFTGTFAPQAGNNVNAGSAIGGNSNTTSFASLFGTPNGNWVFGVRDRANSNTGSITDWSITINYTITGTPQAVTWSPITDLYTDAAATTPYAGQSLTNVYAKPATPGTKIYTATATNAANCTSSSNVTLTVNPVPVVTVLADYCIVPGKVRLTASSAPAGATYVWNTGQTGSIIDVDVADNYDVVATFATGCSSTASINIAVELVTNGDFSAGNTGFYSEYSYVADIPFVSTEMYPEGTYAIGTSGQNYHTAFYGREHSTPTQTGNFMLINGSTTLIGTPARLRTIWQQTVTVLPNTNYYFSAFGMNLNPGSPAQLQFEVNGIAVGTIADLNIAPKPTSNATVDINNWVRFYSNPNWNSGSATTAVIRIINLNPAAGGNDFALDDISFSTLSTFITLVSSTGTDGQTICANNPLTNIVYAIGSGSTGPTITGLPAGVTASFNGVNLTISGTPTVPGNYAYNITTSGNCNPVTATGTITVQSQIINLTTGSNTQTSCKNAPISTIGYTISGLATNATITGLPASCTMVKSGNIFTISGTPTVAGTYNYTITTSGTACASAVVTGTITVQEQNLTNTSGSPAQSLCINTALSNIVYTIGGTATGATLSGTLPTGVTGTFNSGLFIISGTPTQTGIFNYTVTTTGTCNAATAQLSGSITVNPNAIGGSITSIAICVNTSGTLTLTGQSGSILNWEFSTNGGSTWTTIANTTTSQSYTNITVPTMYRAKVSNACSTTFSSIATIAVHNLWTGTISTNWLTGGNWSDGLIASTSCPDVIIPAGTPFSPILGSGTATITNLVIKPGANLVVTGATLQMAGTITNGGTFDARNGTLEFNGTTPQSIAGNIFYTNTLKNLTISNTSGVTQSAAAANIINITGDLAFGNVNNSTLNTANNIVLISNAAGTARVADITNNSANSGNSFNGTVTVERYFPSHRAWRLLTSPLKNTGDIFNSWQAAGNYVPGRGMFVSAPSVTAANGMDYSFYANYSMYTFNPIIGNYVGLTNTKAQLLSPNPTGPANIGYFTFVRGDRNRAPDNTVYPNTNTTTLSSAGNLQTGMQTFSMLGSTGAYQLIGNPYASSVDFAKITKTNILPTRFYVHDPTIGAVGAFVLMEDVGGGVFMPLTLPSSTQRNFIQSGQAFFSQVSNVLLPSSLVFNETNKSSNNNTAIFRPVPSVNPHQTLRANLFQLNANNNTVVVDGSIVEFDNSFDDKVDNQDALKFTNINENLGLLRNNTSLTAERRPLIKDNDTLFLQLTRTTQRSYRFEFLPSKMDTALTAFLQDSYTSKSTPLTLLAKSAYDFDVTSDPNSAVPGRFKIVFKQTAPPPVTRLTVKAYQQAANIAVAWTVENEKNTKEYEVEKSVDGLGFVKVNTTGTSGTNPASITYNWLDVTPVIGNNFYRIRTIANDGKVVYSDIVVVKIDKPTSGIRIYPNPVTDGIIGVEFKNMASGIYQGRLLNSRGQTIISKTINHAIGTSMENIQPDYKLISGIYQLEVIAPDKQTYFIKVIVK